MPVVPELAVAMLATVRLGAMHSVIFAGFFGPSDCRSRAGCRRASMMITADGFYRSGKEHPVEDND